MSCFYTLKNKYSEREIKKAILITIAQKRIKYFEINLTKDVKDLRFRNCKTLMKLSKI